MSDTPLPPFTAPIPPPFDPPGSAPVELPAEVKTGSRLPIFAAIAHGFFCFVAGLWPVASLRSFEAVTGPKADHWLLMLAGLFLAVIGLSMLIAALRRDIAPEVYVLGLGTALALAGTDITFVIERIIPPVYLLDAVAESLFVALWVFAIRDLRRKRRPAIIMRTGSAPLPGAASERGRPDGNG